MNNEENKNQDLNYDFDFASQVTKNENVVEENVEALDDNEIEEFEEVDDSFEETNAAVENGFDVDSDIEKLEEIPESNEEVSKDENNVKKIKILKWEFNFEDVVLVIIGLVIIASIFLLPKIMNIFK